jgi:hypothetical protein
MLKPLGFSFVMAGLVPAIHVFLRYISIKKTWMPGTRPGMTCRLSFSRLGDGGRAAIYEKASG